MIQYSITEQQLRLDIAAAKPDWFTETADILANLPAVPTTKQFLPKWTEIKRVYIKLQNTKCCFCEKPPEGDTESGTKKSKKKSAKYSPLDGDIEQDVEHFRPKSKVKAWVVPPDLVNMQAPRQTSAGGYKFLAYHPFNYAMSCKTCNTQLKGNYFPIDGVRDSAAINPQLMAGEQALLIYPIGTFDTNPEDLIEFTGVSPVAKGQTPFDRWRGEVTIRFFRLDGRTYLDKQRALLLRLLFLELDGASNHPSLERRQKHAIAISNLTAAGAPFANCLRSFQKLYIDKPLVAEAIADACIDAMPAKAKAIV